MSSVEPKTKKNLKTRIILNDQKLWKFFLRNHDKPEFRKSKNSLVQLLIIPPVFNIIIGSSRFLNFGRRLNIIMSFGIYMGFLSKAINTLNSDFLSYAVDHPEFNQIIKKRYHVDFIELTKDVNN